MSYVDVSIGMSSVNYCIPSLPHVLVECDCTCDKMMICVSCFGRPMSLYSVLDEYEYDS